MDFIVVGARPIDDPAIAEDGQRAVGYVYASARSALRTVRKFTSLGLTVSIRTSAGVHLTVDELRFIVKREGP